MTGDKEVIKRVKVVVLGNAEAGKSTLIKTLIPDSINIEYRGRTIALDFGVIEKNGVRFHIFGTPGQKRFEIVRDVISEGADLFIYVFDPLIGISRYDSEVISLLKEKKLKGFFFINLKNSSGEEMDTEKELSTLLDPMNYRFVFGSAKDPEVKKNVLNELLKLI